VTVTTPTEGTINEKVNTSHGQPVYRISSL